MLIRKILTIVKKAFFFIKIFGLKNTLGGIRKYLETKLKGLSSYEYYFILDFNENIKFKEGKITSRKLCINWIIPDVGIGGGGHRTIFRFVNGLEKLGHTNNIYIMVKGGLHWGTLKNTKRIINKYYYEVNAEVFEGTDIMEESDVCIATSWETAYPLYKVRNTKKRIYLVQDYECDFYPKSSAYFFAEQTYKMGHKCITGGKWLANILRKKYNLQCEYFEQGYDPYIYRVDKNIQRLSNTVAFYARYPIARRGFELGVLALQEIVKRRKDINVVFFGWDCSSLRIPFRYKNLGILSERELARLYNRTSLGLIFSLTNYSLVSQEMMACGLPIVDIKGACTEYIYPKDAIVLANPDPKSIAEAILFLLNNEAERKRLQENAFDYIKDLQWEKQIEKVERLIFNL